MDMRKWLIASVIAFVFSLVCMGGMSLFASHMISKEKEWADSNLELSSMQQFAVAVTRWWVNYWYVVGLLMFCGLAALFATVAFAKNKTPLPDTRKSP
jgi:hypothetical protein